MNSFWIPPSLLGEGGKGDEAKNEGEMVVNKGTNYLPI